LSLPREALPLIDQAELSLFFLDKAHRQLDETRSMELYWTLIEFVDRISITLAGSIIGGSQDGDNGPSF